MTLPKRRLAFLGAAAIVTIVTLVLDQLGLASELNARLQDALLVSRPADANIVIVTIDNESIQELGVWPWSRNLHAQLIQNLASGHPQTIAYDVTFAEASSDVTADETLAQALARAETTTNIVLASEAVVAHDAKTITTQSFLEPLTKFSSAVSNFGPTTLLPDHDGIVRTTPLAFSKGAQTLPSFASIVSGNAQTNSSIYRIPFIGAPGTFTRIKAADVIAGRVNPSAFTDKIVFVGATASDLHDEYLTPVSEGQAMPGVEIQANIVQSLREGRSLQVLDNAQKILLGALLALGLMVLAAWTKLRNFIVISAGVAIAYLLLAIGLAANGILMPMTMPFLLMAAITIIDIAARYKEEFTRRAFVQRAFGHYVAPQVVEKLVRGDAPLELGGVQEELTILFSDIRGFTTLSEKLSPQELVGFLNEYLSAMTEVILKEEGTVDKYIGDAIMAFWGAPIAQPDHAERAIRAALGMKKRLAELKKQWAKEGKPEVNIGLGLNTGQVVVGNIGSMQRFDYTVIGDDVNLASRLEGLTKFYGVGILISEATKNKLPSTIVTRQVDKVAVKGKSQAVMVYEVMGFEGDLDTKTQNLLEKYSIALAAYYAQDFSEAKKAFSALAKTDALSKLFVERSTMYLENPPGKNWDGVFVAKEK